MSEESGRVQRDDLVPKYASTVKAYFEGKNRPEDYNPKAVRVFTEQVNGSFRTEVGIQVGGEFQIIASDTEYKSRAS